ncbi:uncharacterized [Tachysurus ichikawai]
MLVFCTDYEFVLPGVSVIKCFRRNPIILGHSVVLQLRSATGLASGGPSMATKDRTKGVMDEEGQPSKVTSRFVMISGL